MSDPLVGKVLDGRYRIVSVIAEGGMGVVYQAEHTVIGRRVAVKVLRAELASDLEIGERFLEEARAAGTLGHPNIVECTDFGSTNDDRPFLVMELLEGADLGEELRRASPFPVRRVLHIARQIAGALAAAHERQIIHRDLKPQNVFLVTHDEDHDRVKLVDFGISKFLGATTQRTGRGQTIGTPDYMAPEQLSDPDGVDARTDIHALGALMYEMLVGRAPFAGGSYQQVAARVMNQRPRPMEDLRADLPDDLVRLVAQCLEKTPAARPAAMQQVIDRLSTLKATTGVPTIPAGQTGPLPLVAGVPPTSVTPPPSATTTPPPAPMPGIESPTASPSTGPQPVSPRSTLQQRSTLIAGGVALVAVGAAVALLLRGRDRAAPPPAPPVAAVTLDAGGAPPGVDDRVLLEVSSPIANATLTLRGESFELPFASEVVAGKNPELLEIAAPGREGRRIWVTLDRARYLDVLLPEGAGMATASAAEMQSATTTGEQVRAARQRQHRDVSPTTAPSSRPPSTTTTTTAPALDASTAEPAAVVRAVAIDASIALPAAVDAGPIARPEPTDAGVAIASPPSGPANGTVDGAAVRAVVRGHMSEVSACYERARMENHAQPLRGKLTIQIAVDGRGKPTSATVAGSTLSSSKLESCVASAVRTWTFPAPAGGVPATFTYPFVFK